MQFTLVWNISRRTQPERQLSERCTRLDTPRASIPPRLHHSSIIISNYYKQTHKHQG